MGGGGGGGGGEMNIVTCINYIVFFNTYYVVKRLTKDAAINL